MNKKTTISFLGTEKVWYMRRHNHLIAIVFFGFLLYANTLGHDYVQDDAIVIYNNQFTTQGIAGIPGILQKDTFFGFFQEEGKSKLVSGGRYRPLSLVMFAVGWEIFGHAPLIGHLVNILLYCITGIMIYLLFCALARNKKTSSIPTLFAFILSLLYLAHPLHTEVIANIKGRDEILSMLGSISALYFLIRYTESSQKKHLIFSITLFFLGLMSKENAICFLAVFPLVLYFFNYRNLGSAAKLSLPYLGVAILFLAIRTSVLGLDFGAAPRELMNNPFIKIENGFYTDFSFSEKAGTILYTLGKYISLLVFPHPLTNDYYPRHVDITALTNWKSILSFLLYAIASIYAIIKYKSRNILGFSILYFLITVSIVSNIIFPIGTNMSERFMYMPSLAFSLLTAVLITYVMKKNKGLGIAFAAILLLGYSYKTITRNNAWKNDYTLFTTDVKTSSQSAKALNAAGGAIQTKVANMPDGKEKTDMIRQGISYLEQATKIHPNYINAFLLQGNSYYYAKDFDKAIKAYENALSINSGYQDARNNLMVALRDGARKYGEKMNDLDTAESMLLRAYQISPSDPETLRLLGITYGVAGQHQKAITYFEKLVTIQPSNAYALAGLSTAYRAIGNIAASNSAYTRAYNIDPKSVEHLSPK